MATFAMTEGLFPVLSTRTHDGVDYTVRRCDTHHPLVLYGKADTTAPVPLAALTLVSSQGNGSLIWARDGDGASGFQGLVTGDNAEFSLRLTNLRHEGMIDFVVMKDDTPLTETDPENRLNQINEIFPMQTVNVECDRETRRAMVLSSLAGDAGPTVKQDERRAHGDAKRAEGTYYWLSVAPKDDCPGLVALFEHTAWRTPEFILCESPAVVLENAVVDGDEGDDDYGDDFEDVLFLREPARGAATPRREHLRADGALSAAAATTPASNAQGRYFTGFADRRSTEAAPATTAATKSKGSKAARVRTDAPAPLRRGVIDRSKAARVTASDRVVSVRSRVTGYTYRFDRAASCVLGLSVAADLELLPSRKRDELAALAAKHLDDRIAGLDAARLRELAAVYPEPTCVVCLDAEHPSVVFMQCGHQCVCVACSPALQTCPMCRGWIVGRIAAQAPASVPEGTPSQ